MTIIAILNIWHNSTVFCRRSVSLLYYFFTEIHRRYSIEKSTWRWRHKLKD